MDDSVVEWLLMEANPAISIYMPVDPSQRDLRAPSARLKNLLRAAEGALRQQGGNWRERAAILAPAQELAEATDFRLHRDPGLALFLAEGRLEVLPLSEPPPELAVAGRSFHLKPLLSFLNQDRRFYILALSTGHVRLLVATPFFRKQVSLAELLPPEVAAEADSRLAAETASGESGSSERLRRGSASAGLAPDRRRRSEMHRRGPGFRRSCR